MNRFALLLVLLLLAALPIVTSAQEGFDVVPMGQNTFQFARFNLPANTQAYLTKIGPCEDNLTNFSLGPTSGQGTLIFTDQPLCPGTYTYTVTVGAQVFTTSVVSLVVDDSVPVPVNPGCVSNYPDLKIGALVQNTEEAGFWMLPSTGPESKNGDPLRVLDSGTQMRIIDGPVCAEEHVWWRMDHRFEFGAGVKSQDLGWMAEEFNDKQRLTVIPNSTIEPPVYPELSSTEPQAVSLLSVQGIRVRATPDPGGERVTAIKTGDGVVKVIGKNGNGAFLQVSLATGEAGWVCTHLTRNNALNFEVPVTDSSTNECFAK